MNKVNERLEKLLNKVNITLNDLPDAHSYEQCCCAKRTVMDESEGDPYEYICHLADVIDKMETALCNAVLLLDGIDNAEETTCPLGCDGCTDIETAELSVIRAKLEHVQDDRDHLMRALVKLIERIF